jgi:hypothetical protein
MYFKKLIKSFQNTAQEVRKFVHIWTALKKNKNPLNKTWPKMIYTPQNVI